MAVMNINENNFEQEVLRAEGIVLMDIWAPWCGPCKMLGPVVEKVAEENDNIKVVKVSADDSPEIAMKYNVSSIPTLIVFKDGQEVNRSVGVISKDQIMDLING